MRVTRGLKKDMSYSFFESKEAIQRQAINAYFKAISLVGTANAAIITPKKKGDGVTVEYFNKMISSYLLKEFIIGGTNSPYDGLKCKVTPLPTKKVININKTNDTMHIETGDICLCVDREKIRLNEVKQPYVKTSSYIFYRGSKIIQKVNDYSQKNVINGETGIIDIINADGSFKVRFSSDKIVFYKSGEENQIELAYALSGHSYQGSQADYIIVAMSWDSYILLSREWLYTAVTRSQKHCYVIANKKAFDHAVRTSHARRRTWIQKLIQGLKILFTL